MPDASCHCGAVRFTAEGVPDQLTSCNCSLCHRLGTVWAYYRPGQVTFTAGAGTTVPYVQGDRTLATHHCPTCACVTHWESLEPGTDRMGVNARLFPREVMEGTRIRRFDGADSWMFLD